LIFARSLCLGWVYGVGMSDYRVFDRSFWFSYDDYLSVFVVDGDRLVVVVGCMDAVVVVLICCGWILFDFVWYVVDVYLYKVVLLRLGCCFE